MAECFRAKRLNFLDLFFSCKEAALIASSYCMLNGRASCYGTACKGLGDCCMIDSGDELVSCILAPPPHETHEAADVFQEKHRKQESTYRELTKFVGQRRNRYVSAARTAHEHAAQDCL